LNDSVVLYRLVTGFKLTKEIFMKKFNIYAIALILGSIGGILTMIAHPVGVDVAPTNENASHAIQLGIMVHALAVASVMIQYFGLLGFCRNLGLERPIVSAALVIYGFSAVAVMCAAVLDGFGATALAKDALSADEPTRKLLSLLSHYNYYVNQGFAKIFLVGSSVAVIIWSGLLLKLGGFAKIIGVLGCAISSICLILFVAGHLQTDRHGFGLFFFAQSVWMVLTAVWIFRNNDSTD
jgi:hypothetical protein